MGLEKNCRPGLTKGCSKRWSRTKRRSTSKATPWFWPTCCQSWCTFTSVSGRDAASTIQGVIASLTENISYLLEHLPGHSIMKGRTILTIKVGTADQSICEIFEHCFHARIRKVQSTDIKEIKQK